MAVKELSASDVAEKLRGRVKFFPIGDPDRNLLVKSYTVIEELLTAESVQDWLQARGVNLTPRQRKILDLDTFLDTHLDT